MSVNYPGSLDNGSSLVNTRASGNTITASDHNDLANATIAVETKIGAGSSTPTTTGNVLTVTSAGQTAWATPTGGGGTSYTAFYNVKTYGAVGDGSHNDTSAIQAAINAALSSPLGSGTVYFPAGVYKITSTLNCTSATGGSGGYGVILRGDGHNASQIFKNSSFGMACAWNGNGGPAGNNTQFGGMVDISVNGNASTGGLIQTNSAQQMFFRGCSFIGSNDVAWDLNTMQDSYFSQITFNNNGSTSLPVVNIYGGAYGTSNMLWFDQIRIETFLNGAIWIKRGSGATGGGNNGFFFTQCKFENYPTVYGDICVFDSYTQQLNMAQIFISFGQYASGYSTPVNGITYGDGSTGAGDNQVSIRDVFMNTGPTSNIGNAVVNINGNGHLSGPILLDNIFGDANMNTAQVVVNGASGADVQINQVGGPGTLIGGDGSGHRAKAGTGTFASGTATISTPAVSASNRIVVTHTSTSANIGIPYISSISAGTSFTVKSSNAADANTFNWQIVN